MTAAEKIRAALAALEAAQAACVAAGFEPTVESLRHGPRTDALSSVMLACGAAIASADRQAVPIAVGDEVTVHDQNARGRAPERLAVVRVGRALVHLQQYRGEVAYRLDSGRSNDNFGHTWIDPDDLARITRDLVAKRQPKPAPVPVEIATAKVQS